MSTHEPLVFIPGWGYHASVWQDTASNFDDHETYCIDLPNDITNGLDAWVDNLPSNATLIGWSLGGLLAIHACSVATHKFSRLALVSSSACFAAKNHWDGISSETMENFQKTFKNDKTALFRHFYSLVAFPSHSRNNLQYLLKNAQHKGPETVSATTCEKQLTYLFNTDLRDQFTALTLPILSVAGEKDVILPPTHADHVIKNAGHAPFVTHKTAFCAILKDFLNEKPHAK